MVWPGAVISTAPSSGVAEGSTETIEETTSEVRAEELSAADMTADESIRASADDVSRILFIYDRLDDSKFFLQNYNNLRNNQNNSS